MSPPPARRKGPGSLLHEVRERLRAQGDATRAAAQQRYMKSAMPYHGVMVPAMRRIATALVRELAFDDADAYVAAVRALWDGATHREERYVALELLLAARFAHLRGWHMVPTYEALIVDGAWWDLVDTLAPAALAELAAREPRRTATLLRRWAKAGDLWLRRAAILGQLKRKADTDTALLAEVIEHSLEYPEFFVRKAIGWALREHAYTDPAWVRAFVHTHAARMAPLARREALKHLGADDSIRSPGSGAACRKAASGAAVQDASSEAACRKAASEAAVQDASSGAAGKKAASGAAGKKAASGAAVNKKAASGAAVNKKAGSAARERVARAAERRAATPSTSTSTFKTRTPE